MGGGRVADLGDVALHGGCVASAQLTCGAVSAPAAAGGSPAPHLPRRSAEPGDADLRTELRTASVGDAARRGPRVVSTLTC